MRQTRATVGLATGTDRRANVRAALEHVRDSLTAVIRDQVMIKPNFLSSSNPLACTHADAVRGVLDVLMTLPRKPERVIIAEGGNEPISGEAFKNFGYTSLPDEYDLPIDLIDLNRETRWQRARVYLAGGQPAFVRMPRTVLDCPCTISLAVAKTHDAAIVTLALKNMIMGTLRQKDRIKMHGYPSHSHRVLPREAQVLNRNLIRVARFLAPDFGVIDGTVGLQGNGPGGTDTRALGVAAASADVFAVDAVIAKAMGFEPLEVGTIFYGDAMGLGVGDLERIDVIGANLYEAIIPFKPHEKIELQRQWRVPV